MHPDPPDRHKDNGFAQNSASSDTGQDSHKTREKLLIGMETVKEKPILSTDNPLPI